MTSDLGLTPSNDGNIIRLTIPQLTQDRRKELTKLVGKLTEEGKVALRNVRRDALKALDKLEKDKALSEDQLTAAKDAMQKVTDGCVTSSQACASNPLLTHTHTNCSACVRSRCRSYVKQVDDLAEAKNKELMQV